MSSSSLGQCRARRSVTATIAAPASESFPVGRLNEMSRPPIPPKWGIAVTSAKYDRDRFPSLLITNIFSARRCPRYNPLHHHFILVHRPENGRFAAEIEASGCRRRQVVDSRSQPDHLRAVISRSGRLPVFCNVASLRFSAPSKAAVRRITMRTGSRRSTDAHQREYPWPPSNIRPRLLSVAQTAALPPLTAQLRGR